MSKLYNNIVSLCESRGITGYRMCKEIGIQPSILTDLKMGRKEGLSSKNADKIARYFGVSVGYLLGTVTLAEEGMSFSDGSGYGGGSGSGAGFGDGTGYGGPLPNRKTEEKEKLPTSNEEFIEMIRKQNKGKAQVFFCGADGKVIELSPDEEAVLQSLMKLRKNKND